MSRPSLQAVRDRNERMREIFAKGLLSIDELARREGLSRHTVAQIIGPQRYPGARRAMLERNRRLRYL
jgi:DNA invertase Pin-like site-specific DNA recombinase